LIRGRKGEGAALPNAVWSKLPVAIFLGGEGIATGRLLQRFWDSHAVTTRTTAAAEDQLQGAAPPFQQPADSYMTSLSLSSITLSISALN